MEQNNNNLVGTSTDLCAGCVQLWMRSAEPPGHIVMRIETTSSGWVRSGGGVVDNTLDYKSWGRKIDPPLLRSFG